LWNGKFSQGWDTKYLTFAPQGTIASGVEAMVKMEEQRFQGLRSLAEIAVIRYNVPVKKNALSIAMKRE
jgi:hypothetical protein